MTDIDLITSTRERVRTGFNPGGRQVYTPEIILDWAGEQNSEGNGSE